ncbi:hypothetical protein CLAFUW4_14259 [Fulvia fulva]|uniref:N-acetyltransferase domain-containing protein n=1 Tax=Passalora fulva TaxID=5499 RepID=A0A9Q8PMQ8_PASFU|nr:uncharacterized protein CLAFUR5_14092 [Fulvia fulva]KAK4609116.1 hypothetical protein CLAFUR4_14260 [Fulvia fulva]KAK4609761.1 hypothetical protein CLAFUR0_14264 [Fulvia fulva]UJO25395.1 hypothetical protein CLAFUR5_14092 [Fulvia fulva]WPV22694.1 hypothetical protein CLAFUW4_14259 [Fulvia fulva]WPV37868.1 hypothetical protein CLAFUW7_14268 [Fulvia fulva]
MRVLSTTTLSHSPRMAYQTLPKILLRPDAGSSDDIAHIRDVIRDAFAAKSHLDHKEADIVDSLRKAGALTISLAAYLHQSESGTIVGHIAASPVLIDGESHGWFGLGPVSLRPAHQGQGIGSALVKGALEALRDAGAAGCVVAGSPRYYHRFGFQHNPAITFEGAPAKYFQSITLNGPTVSGKVAYHEAFNIR